MGSGTLTLALLVLAAGPTPDVWPINQSTFKIPVHVDLAHRAAIKELRLFVSNDEGKTWKQTATATPDQEAFPFTAPSDGVYWFTVCAIDQQNNQDPADIYRVPPSQKILVDTTKPAVRITAAERQGDDIVLNWEIQEDHADLATLKLEYRTVDAPASVWYMQPLSNPVLVGTTKFRLPAPGPISLRVQIQDLAGNLGTDTREVAATAAPGAASGPSSLSATGGTVPASNTSYTTPVGSAQGNNQALPAKSEPRSIQEPARQALPTSNYPQATAGPGLDLANRLVASSENAGNSSSSSAASALGQGLPGSSGSLQVVNTKQVTLDFRVDKVGPSGIGRVDLWITEDLGKTWRLFPPANVDISPPIASESKADMRQLKVDLPGEGLYGFTVVVQSKAGLGKRPPVGGEPPQMRLEVDLTPPVAQLYAPEPDPNRPNALIISWTATDRNIGPRPITLQWAERKEGTWETIDKNLENTGRYSWELPANFPPRVYLRLIVQDAAGNPSTAETREPVLVDLSEPEGKIIGLTKKNALQ
jgi:hypothetical protein